jgi:hypothetical protein
MSGTRDKQQITWRAIPPITTSDEGDTPLEDLNGRLTGILVLIEVGASTQRDHGLAERVFVAAVNGVGTAAARGVPGDLQLVPLQRGQGLFLHSGFFRCGQAKYGTQDAGSITLRTHTGGHPSVLVGLRLSRLVTLIAWLRNAPDRLPQALETAEREGEPIRKDAADESAWDDRTAREVPTISRNILVGVRIT